MTNEEQRQVKMHQQLAQLGGAKGEPDMCTKCQCKDCEKRAGEHSRHMLEEQFRLRQEAELDYKIDSDPRVKGLKALVRKELEE